MNQSWSNTCASAEDPVCATEGTTDGLLLGDSLNSPMGGAKMAIGASKGPVLGRDEPDTKGDADPSRGTTVGGSLTETEPEGISLSCCDCDGAPLIDGGADPPAATVASEGTADGTAEASAGVGATLSVGEVLEDWFVADGIVDCVGMDETDGLMLAVGDKLVGALSVGVDPVGPAVALGENNGSGATVGTEESVVGLADAVSATMLVVGV